MTKEPMITLSVDVTMLDKSRFKRFTRKNGKEAVFCDLVLFEAKDTRYGDYIVKQGISKEERMAKKEMPIIGNGKIVGGGNQSAPAPAAEAGSQQEYESDVPF